MTIAWYDLAGYVGAFLVVVAFLLLQVHKLHGNGWIYQLMNILGAIGLILAAIGQFSLSIVPVLAGAIVWLLIGIYGIVYNRRRNQAGRVL